MLGATAIVIGIWLLPLAVGLAQLRDDKAVDIGQQTNNVIDQKLVRPGVRDRFRIMNKAVHADKKHFLIAQLCTKVILHNSSVRHSSLWTMETGSDGWVRLCNTDFDKMAGRVYLVAHGGNQTITWSRNAGENSWWHMEPDGDGWFHLRNKDQRLQGSEYLIADDQGNVHTAKMDTHASLWKLVPVGQTLDIAGESAELSLMGKAETRELEIKAREADMLHERLIDMQKKANDEAALHAQLDELRSIVEYQNSIRDKVGQLKAKTNAGAFYEKVSQLEIQSGQADNVSARVQETLAKQSETASLQKSISKLEKKIASRENLEARLNKLRNEAKDMGALEKQVQALEKRVADMKASASQ